MNAQQVIDNIRLENGYPRPDWMAIDAQLAALPPESQDAGWGVAARSWLDAIARHVGSEYSVVESENFQILSSLPTKDAEALARFAERALAGILRRLDGMAVDNYFGKHVVLVFATRDQYYEYISYFYPDEGEYPMSGGVFLRQGYGHMVVPYDNLTETQAAIAHEFTHACLRHLPIPLWLNEGLAVTIEDEICGNQPLRMDPERLREHMEFWTEETIQEFWGGSSFGRTDEGLGLSYELARYCIRALTHDLDPFVRFVNEASFADGGEAAANEVFGGSLGGLIEQFFGEGDWSPKVPT